jgi:hypothetical protein
VVLPGDWLVSSVVFFSLPVWLKLWGEVALQIMQCGQSYWIPQLITVLLFICSCLVSSSLIEVGAVQFWMLPSGSEDHFSYPLSALLWRKLIAVFVYWDFSTGVFFLSLPSFSVPGSVFHPPSLLSMLDYSLLFVFQFCRAVWFWILLSGSRDQFCDPLPALLWWVAYQSPSTVSLHCLSCIYLLIFQHWVYLLALPSLSSAVSAFHLIPPLSMFDYSSLLLSFVVGEISLSRGCAGLCSLGWIWGSHVVCGAYLFVLSIDVQARNGAKFSQCNVAWGGFP